MDLEAIKRFEYEEQIFQFSSQFFADSFKNFLETELNQYIDALVDNFEKKLINDAKNPEEFARKVKEMKDTLKYEYTSSLNAEFGVIKENISKFMDIPNHVLLNEDLPVKSGSSVALSEIDREIDLLCCKYKAMRYLKKKLQNEFDKADYTIFTLNSLGLQELTFKLLDTNEIISYTKSNLDLVRYC